VVELLLSIYCFITWKTLTNKDVVGVWVKEGGGEERDMCRFPLEAFALMYVKERQFLGLDNRITNDNCC